MGELSVVMLCYFRALPHLDHGLSMCNIWVLPHLDGGLSLCSTTRVLRRLARPHAEV